MIIIRSIDKRYKKGYQVSFTGYTGPFFMDRFLSIDNHSESGPVSYRCLAGKGKQRPLGAAGNGGALSQVQIKASHLVPNSPIFSRVFL